MYIQARFKRGTSMKRFANSEPGLEYYDLLKLNRVQVVGMSLPSLNRKDESDEVPFGKSPRPAQDGRSSTQLKRHGIDRRHGDTWGQDSARSKGFFLHSERMAWDDNGRRSPDSWSQREQMEAEAELMRNFRRTHGISHREPIDLLMGGQKVMFFERMDILGELARLKSLSLPAKAKELYVGKGFKLPSTHTLNKPPRARKHSASSNMTTTTGYKSFRSHGGPASISEDPIIGQNDDSAYDSAPPGMETTTDTDTDGEQLNPTSRPLFYGEEPLGEDPEPEEEQLPINPLKINQLDELFAMRNLQEIKTIFRTITLDIDGVIEFSHIERDLPDELTGAERRFMKDLHEVTSATVPFGEEEFVCLRLVSEKVIELEGDPKHCFETLNFEVLPMRITEYAGLYQTKDRRNLGTISVTSLQEILSNTISPTIRSGDGSFTRIINNLGQKNEKDITKVEYVSWIPYFTSLEAK